jgi:hypothetical protein
MAARFTISELLNATGGTLYAPSDFGDPVIDGITIDTRTLQPGMAYVAIRGGTFDGHRFIPDAMEKGAVLSISDADVPFPHIRVENTVLAYQNIAKMHRERFGLPVGEDYSVWDLDDAYLVDPAEFLSKGRATPFAGMELFGRCLLTVCGGKPVYSRF